MEKVLGLKRSNCKNCYKYIRHCPVKSIKFSDGQANIISDECILCGCCFVNCPQDAKQVRDDIPAVKGAAAKRAPGGGQRGPSFYCRVPTRDFAAMRRALLQFGFADAEETAIGAAIVKTEYERMVASGEHDVIISSCCHSINALIQKYHPLALPYLAPVLSSHAGALQARKSSSSRAPQPYSSARASRKRKGRPVPRPV